MVTAAMRKAQGRDGYASARTERRLQTNDYREEVPSKICRPDTEMAGPSRASSPVCQYGTTCGVAGLKPGIRIARVCTLSGRNPKLHLQPGPSPTVSVRKSVQFSP